MPAANDSPRITASDDGYLILNYDDFLSENLLLIRKDNSEDLTDEEFSRLSELVFMFGVTCPQSLIQLLPSNVRPSSRKWYVLAI